MVIGEELYVFSELILFPVLIANELDAIVVLCVVSSAIVVFCGVSLVVSLTEIIRFKCV